jgi:hypothetical protein
MSVDDIPLNRPGEEVPASRLTLQYFIGPSLLGTVIPIIAPHNSDAQQPQDTREWPPAIIVDLFYASAALKAWSSESFINYVRERSKDAYYNKANGQSGPERYPLRSRVVFHYHKTKLFRFVAEARAGGLLANCHPANVSRLVPASAIRLALSPSRHTCYIQCLCSRTYPIVTYFAKCWHPWVCDNPTLLPMLSWRKTCEWEIGVPRASAYTCAMLGDRHPNADELLLFFPNMTCVFA